jgi:hypothetical protein
MRHVTRLRAPVRAAAMMAAACAMLTVTSDAAAQAYNASAGWGGGYVQYAPFIDSGDDSPVDIGFGGTWTAVAQAEGWKGNRLGLRLGGFYSHGTVTLPARNHRADAYGVETAALLRIIPPRENGSASAYLIGGGGVIWFGLGQGDDVLIEDSNVIYSPDEARQYMALGGGGIEVLTGIRVADGRIGVRLEGVDQMVLGRPFRPADGEDSGMMHNIRFTLTLFTGIDLF